MKRVTAIAILIALAILAVDGVILVLSGAEVKPEVRSEVTRDAATDPASDAVPQSGHSAEIIREDPSGVSEMLPPDRLAEAISQAKGAEELTPDVARAVAVAVVNASSNMWLSRERMVTSGKEPGFLVTVADYWLAVWPTLDYYVREGRIKREVVARKTPRESLGSCMSTLDHDTFRMAIDTGEWRATFTVNRKENPPERELLEQIFARAERDKMERKR